MSNYYSIVPGLSKFYTHGDGFVKKCDFAYNVRGIIRRKAVNQGRTLIDKEVVKLAEDNVKQYGGGLTPKAKIWIELDGEVVFGGGRMDLFEAIEKYGSIRQAAINLGMSYRAAWGKIKDTEERMELELLEKHAGGAQSGAVLTAEARELLSLYRKFKEESNKVVDDLFISHFRKYLAIK